MTEVPNSIPAHFLLPDRTPKKRWHHLYHAAGQAAIEHIELLRVDMSRYTHLMMWLVSEMTDTRYETYVDKTVMSDAWATIHRAGLDVVDFIQSVGAAIMMELEDDADLERLIENVSLALSLQHASGPNSAMYGDPDSGRIVKRADSIKLLNDNRWFLTLFILKNSQQIRDLIGEASAAASYQNAKGASDA